MPHENASSEPGHGVSWSLDGKVDLSGTVNIYQ